MAKSKTLTNAATLEQTETGRKLLARIYCQWKLLERGCTMAASSYVYGLYHAVEILDRPESEELLDELWLLAMVAMERCK